MPRPKKPGGPEPKTRSRNGCWPCKTRKVKCGEEKPNCSNCERQGESCDYSIRLNWEGRTKRKARTSTPESPSASTNQETGTLGAFTFDGIATGNTSHGPFSEATPIKLDSQKTSSSSEPDKGYLHYHAFAARSPIAFSSTELQTENTTLPVERVRMDPLNSPYSESSLIDPLLVGSGNARYSILKDIPSPLGQDMNSMRIPSSNGQGVRDQVSAAQLSRFREQTYPSPADSSMSSPKLPNVPNMSYGGPDQSTLLTRMPPPYLNSAQYEQPGFTARGQQDFPPAADHRSKRMRLSPSSDFRHASQRKISTYDNHAAGAVSKSRLSPQAMRFRSYSPANGTIGVPLTPTASLANSDDNQFHSAKMSPSESQDSPETGRLSVNSLLAGPLDRDDSSTDSFRTNFGRISTQLASDVGTQTVYYGIDRGLPDLDLPNNSDSNALKGLSPSLDINDLYDSTENSAFDDPYAPAEFGFGLYGTNTAHSQGGYYAKAVPVTISTSLEPLPDTLKQNPMNLLYFHHFLNHTARILVPHDCSENPFKSILPQMAVRDINLLHLLLAYSASHRARLLKHTEPANRIAIWVRDVFPTLRHALSDSTSQISNSNLATAIMLASLEIISPNTFEVPVPWQNHLNVARRMILARGGAQSVHRKDKVSYFLSRWFAYLDVLGSLSGSKNDQPLFSGNYWATDNDLDDPENEFQIDCLLGFTSRCVSILAKIAELARQCDGERIDSNGRTHPLWTPTLQMTLAAEKLKADLQEARTHKYTGCPHRHADNEIEDGWDSLEMVATNEAFHWAGLVHLDRRVLGKSSRDPEVQNAVREIVGALYKVRKGGTAEACLLFPMFTAGCDAQDLGQRELIMERLRSVEGSGMTQVHKARRLMEKVWETGRPWETLVTGEFFG